MKKVYILLSTLAVLVFCSSCNDEWKDEQYEHSISFKAPLSNLGVSPIYIPYYTNVPYQYQLPLIVSGSTTNNKNITVHVAVDSDTLVALNNAQFSSRTDHHYTELSSSYFSMPSTVEIKAGEDVGLMQIDFTLQGIDLVNKWLLPLKIEENDAYTVNGRKHYSKALLHVIPFNAYSETYSGIALSFYSKGYEHLAPIVRQTIQTYTVDENTIFFYAGNIDVNRADRGLYKVYAKFNRLSPDGLEEEVDEKLNSDEFQDVEFGEVVFSTDNDAVLEFDGKTANYKVTKRKDDVRPYLVIRQTTISDIDYEFVDYTDVPGEKFGFVVRGSLIQERKINTQIPDKDQAIQW